jgi:hypothetical protein
VDLITYTAGVNLINHPPTCVLIPIAIEPGVQLRVRNGLSQLMSQD